MKRSRNSALSLTAAAALATLLGTSALADWHPRGDQPNASMQSGDYRRDARAEAYEGRITRIARERGWYRVQLDNYGEWFRVPDLEVRNAPRGYERIGNLRVGTEIRLFGVHSRRGGFVEVNAAEWLDSRGYADRDRNDHHIRGVVERVERWRRVVYIRDQSRRQIRVDLDRLDRRDRDSDDLRRGDLVAFEGVWRSNVFEAYRIEDVRRR